MDLKILPLCVILTLILVCQCRAQDQDGCCPQITPSQVKRHNLTSDGRTITVTCNRTCGSDIGNLWTMQISEKSYSVHSPHRRKEVMDMYGLHLVPSKDVNNHNCNMTSYFSMRLSWQRNYTIIKHPEELVLICGAEAGDSCPFIYTHEPVVIYLKDITPITTTEDPQTTSFPGVTDTRKQCSTVSTTYIILLILLPVGAGLLFGTACFGIGYICRCRVGQTGHQQHTQIEKKQPIEYNGQTENNDTSHKMLEQFSQEEPVSSKQVKSQFTLRSQQDASNSISSTGSGYETQTPASSDNAGSMQNADTLF